MLPLVSRLREVHLFLEIGHRPRCDRYLVRVQTFDDVYLKEPHNISWLKGHLEKSAVLLKVKKEKGRFFPLCHLDRCYTLSPSFIKRLTVVSLHNAADKQTNPTGNMIFILDVPTKIASSQSSASVYICRSSLLLIPSSPSSFSSSFFFFILHLTSSLSLSPRRPLPLSHLSDFWNG